MDDFLIAQNRDAHARLTQLGVPHEYVEYSGEHDWAYWDRHILDALAFLGRHFGFAFRAEDHLYPAGDNGV